MRSGLPSSTALFTLSARAAETRRGEESRLIFDPYAGKFLAQLGVSRFGLSPLSWMVKRGGLASFVALRHRLMDDLFLEAFRQGCKQVVNLGSGFDSRLLRFKEQFSQGDYFEVDHPNSFRLKSYLLNCELDKSWEIKSKRLSIDFERGDLGEILLNAGFSVEKKSFVFWEGVTYYLDRMAIHGTLAKLAPLLSSGSSLVFDYWNPEIRLTRNAPFLWSRQTLMTGGLKLLGEALKSSFTMSQLNLALSTHGFAAVNHFDSSAMKKRYFGHGDERRVFHEMPVVLVERR